MLHEQSEAGRDLTRLMGDLILHFRNLLVAQADPASLNGELNAETVKELVEQAARVAPEKMLELIEQFAGAEARMRWAPNRQMHFEIALIRAVQTLEQATLSEVLDTLTAMRGGSEPPARPKLPEARPKPQPAARAPRAVSSAKVAEVVEASVATTAVNTVQEEPETPSGSEPTRELATAPAETPIATRDSVQTLEERWPEVMAEVRRVRPLIMMWVEAGTLLGVDHGVVRLGFPQEQSLAAESCQQANNRTLLEEIMSTVAGEALTLKAFVQPGLAVKVPAPREPEKVADPMAEFKNDPLIRRALEIFRAQIQPV
jgi:DNA polymerase III subunit gamma/tau